MPCSNLLTVKHAGLIRYFVKISSIKLLSYKVTVKHFTHNIIFEFYHNKRKQCSNEEPKEMPLRVQLNFFLLHQILLRVKTSCFPWTSTQKSSLCGWVVVYRVVFDKPFLTVYSLVKFKKFGQQFFPN